jgi:hypothetical protein
LLASNLLLAAKLGHGLGQFGKHFVLLQQDHKVFKVFKVQLVLRVRQVRQELKVSLDQQVLFQMLQVLKV